MLKEGQSVISPFLVTLFNKTLQTQNYPEEWSIGIITPLLKTGETDNPDNCRGITLNSWISKLFTRLLNNRLTEVIENKNLFKHNQIGFRKGFHTADHVLTVKTLIGKYLSQKKKLCLCFVDFKKAYDTVWRIGLLSKLRSYRISNRFMNLLYSMYSKTKSNVKLQNGLTRTFPTTIRLEQECNLSPALFNLLINDINNIFDEISYQPAQLADILVNSLLYADDLILVSESGSGLQNCLKKLQTYCDKWKLKVNTKNRKTMKVEERQSRQSEENFLFGETPIEECKSYTYLGTVISNNGKFKANIKQLCKTASRAMYTLLCHTNKYSGVNIKLLMDLFDKIIVPICTYNSEVWGSALFTKQFLAIVFYLKINRKTQYRKFKYRF